MGGTARFSPGGGIQFKKAIEGKKVRFEDYTNFQITLRFLAGAMGLPFMPVRSLLETDVVKRWGFDEEFRAHNPRIPDKKITVIENPFSPNGAEKVVLVPAINPDVTLIHAQQADRQVTLRIKGLTYTDIEQAKAAKYLIVSCEELIETETIRENPDQNQIPFFMVDAIVVAPYGAHPTACYGYYDFDPHHLNLYREMAPDDETFQRYLDEYVLGVKSHDDYLHRIGMDRLSQIQADPKLGYRPGLDRRGRLPAPGAPPLRGRPQGDVWNEHQRGVGRVLRHFTESLYGTQSSGYLRSCTDRSIWEPQYHMYRGLLAPQGPFSGLWRGMRSASYAGRTIIFMKQEKRKFVERVDYLSTPGWIPGPGGRKNVGLPGGAQAWLSLTWG